MSITTGLSLKGYNMKNKSVLENLKNLVMYGLLVYFIFYINNIVATILFTFIFTNIILLVDELLEAKISHKDSKLMKAIDQIKKMNNKSEKTVNIITLLYPSIFITIIVFSIFACKLSAQISRSGYIILRSLFVA